MPQSMTGLQLALKLTLPYIDSLRSYANKVQKSRKNPHPKKLSCQLPPSKLPGVGRKGNGKEF